MPRRDYVSTVWSAGGSGVRVNGVTHLVRSHSVTWFVIACDETEELRPKVSYTIVEEPVNCLECVARGAGDA